MGDKGKTRLFRFGVFEAEEDTLELRRQGMRVKINAQPFQVLLMLLEKPGELVLREEIQQVLWPEGTFVDFEHSLNSAVNKIREALGDSAAHPRYVETLARRGYRFLAPVERVEGHPAIPAPSAVRSEPLVLNSASPPSSEPNINVILASPEELPRASRELVRALFLLLQLMYLSFYIGALANLGEIGDLLVFLRFRSHTVMVLLILTAAILIPIRLFLIAAIAFHPPGLKAKFLKLFPLLLLLDELWSLSPFLLLHHINVGLALGATAALVYSPFAQRSLILMYGERQV